MEDVAALERDTPHPSPLDDLQLVAGQWRVRKNVYNFRAQHVGPCLLVMLHKDAPAASCCCAAAVSCHTVVANEQGSN